MSNSRNRLEIGVIPQNMKFNFEVSIEDKDQVLSHQTKEDLSKYIKLNMDGYMKALLLDCRTEIICQSLNEFNELHPDLKMTGLDVYY
jgi:hypothetical protein